MIDTIPFQSLIIVVSMILYLFMLGNLSIYCVKPLKVPKIERKKSLLEVLF